MNSELTPVPSDDRIDMLDATRGIAVLGILLMNITSFGLPDAYDDPTVWGARSSADIAVWKLMSLLFEGTMRGLFTLLFGASALLFLQRHVGRSTDLRPADLYFRRTLWLIAFGCFNGYILLWDGDVLFYYGVVGLLLFVLRNLPPKRLLMLAAVAMILQTSVSVIEWHTYHEAQSAATAADIRQASGELLSDEEAVAIDRFSNLQAEWRPSQEDLQLLVDNIRDSYTAAFWLMSERTWYMETEAFFRHGLLECLGMMLLGMALFKWGVLSGTGATRTYVWMIVIGYAIGLTVNGLEIRAMVAENFTPEVMLRTLMTYDLGRIPTTLAHLGVIGLLCKSAWAAAAVRWLNPVGRMALTNYLTQSALCMFIFTGAGLALYGQLARHELYYIVFAIWGIQVIWSTLWLRRFRFGPMEWLWRSLTYGQWQPLRHAEQKRSVASA